MKNLVQNIASIWNKHIHRALSASRLRFFTLLLACIASLGAQSSSFCDNLTWTLKNGVLTISGKGAMTNYSFTLDPESYNLSSPWGYYYDSTTSIIIKDGVTSIGDCAFSCDDKTIGGDSPLRSVTIPNSVTSIGDWAFSSCDNLTAITIPNSVTSIGESAFSDCAGLTSVTIPNSVKSIGDGAFSGCGSLKSVKIPNSVTSIGKWAFSGCSSLTSPVYNNHVFVRLPEKYSGAYTIPNGIKTIAAGTFSGCTGLTSITIPKSVTSIGDGAFAGCSNLKSVTIPNSVTSIGDRAFAGCSNLKSVTIPNSIINIGGWVFEGCSSLTSPVYNNHVFIYLPKDYSGTYTIPDGIETIAEGAFSGCKKLTFVSIPSSVTSIKGDWAFEYCSSLNSPIYNDNVFAYLPENYSGSYKIPDGIKTIAGRAFQGCKNLTSIEIPNSVTSIGNSAFFDCSALTSVTIPNSVTSIGNSAFEHCSSLTSPVYNNHVFVCLPEKHSGAYTIPNGIETIAAGAFYDCTDLTAIIIPISVTSIGEGSFESCSSLTSVSCYSIAPPTFESKDGYGLFGVAQADPSDVTLYVPFGYGEVYEKSDIGWRFSHIEEIYVTPSMMLSSELDAANQHLSQIVQQHNEVINRSPYTQYLNKNERNRYLHTYSPFQIPKAYDYDQAKAFCDSLQRVADSLRQQDPAMTVTSIKDYLRATRPDDFVKAYLKENPTAKAHLESEHKEYRCHYASFTDFVIQYEQGLLQPSERNCRELKWQEYKPYYNNKKAFDADYDKGDEHLEAHKRHYELKWAEYKQYYSSREAFDADYHQGDATLEIHKKREIKWAECADYYEARYIFDFDYDKGETVVDAHRRRIDEAWSSLQQLPGELLVKKKLIGASESKKEDILNLFSLYRQLKPSPHFQSLAADFLISRNKKMSKEYEKNGAYFSSKNAFLTAYFSGDYKHIIKSMKK